MTVEFVIEQARSGELRSMSVKDKTDKVIIHYVNLALIELYKRFNLKTKVEVVETSVSTPVYTLRSSDVNQVVSVYDSLNRELSDKRTVEDDQYDYTQINYNTFMLQKPVDGELLFVYKAAPTLVTSVSDELELPYAMLEALLHYVGYRAHGAVDGNIQAENNTHYMRFGNSCSLLVAEGYAVDTAVVNVGVEKKGFI